jgi:hypothetical protein
MDIIFRKSKEKTKKYDVILPNGVIISFGNINYQHYKDSTPLKLYSNLDHLDENRRRLFRSRFKKLFEKNKNNIYSPIFWSWYMLW